MNRRGPYFYRVKKTLLGGKANWKIQMENKLVPFIWFSIGRKFSERSEAKKRQADLERMVEPGYMGDWSDAILSATLFWGFIFMAFVLIYVIGKWTLGVING